MAGSDHYTDGQGAMSWKLLGLIPVVRAAGGDVLRSAAGRASGEAVWVPTALLPRFGVTWTATDDLHVTAGNDSTTSMSGSGSVSIRRPASVRWSLTVGVIRTAAATGVCTRSGST